MISAMCINRLLRLPKFPRKITNEIIGPVQNINNCNWYDTIVVEANMEKFQSGDLMYVYTRYNYQTR